ncbi:phage major capsid protein [Paenibacillus aquistagni]|uniref:Phage major capsid protein, HK97 family n=1 Tax=Paenibacillus aquistagni TaxID=1852522 RepID=A0A1X7LWG3_9BACL|nr:phage major capsid protein [Paenibacillus aquistagni]SMG58236.1 phage major capsid protein, HK97 family [Paenibacillus aquistagni]
MKKKLQALLAKKEARKAELGNKANTTTSIEEMRSINTELESLNIEILELRSMIDSMPNDEEDGELRDQLPHDHVQQRSGSTLSASNVIGSFGLGRNGGQQERAQEPTDVYGTLEYRSAFMKFAKTGQITPELRADATATTGDISAVIPTTILNEVITKLKVYGQVFKRVRKLNIKGGVEVPILSLKPTATWIGEGKSDKQKVQANTKVSFSYHGLECKVSISLLADTTTLEGFETTITDLIVEAMVKAVDLAVIRGDGTGKPKGIINDTRVPSEQIISLTDDEFKSWEAWKKKVFAKMPLAYKAGATFLMASGTYDGYIDGMVDSTGQPIGRTNYGIVDAPQGRFGGKEVIEVEDDVIVPYDGAAEDEVVAIYCNLGNYGFNSNMQMTLFRYLDHDTNEWIDKAILIADGKLIDPNGVVIVKKAVKTP